jgi:hypothetical protein
MEAAYVSNDTPPSSKYNPKFGVILPRVPTALIQKTNNPRLVKITKGSSPNDYYDVLRAHKQFTEVGVPEFKFGTEKK